MLTRSFFVCVLILLCSSITILAMGGGGGGSVIDPPIGSILKDPVTMPDINSDPNVVEVNLEAKIAPIKINGTTANLMTFNGYYPGPTIKVKKGTILRVH